MKLEPDRNCWRIENATRATVIIDADDYFNAARAAMLKARHRIMLVGWDFDARIELGRHPPDDGPPRVGDFILWLVERTPGLEVFLLRWDVGAIKTLGRGSTIVTMMKWMRHPHIHTKLDSIHPPGASHHQKIVVIDDCFAFCGGIDMTGARWDTRAHRDEEPARHRPNGKPYDPWHDATSALEGPVAKALGDLCRDRWQRAGGDAIEAVPGTDDCWPDALPVQFHDVDVGIARSIPLTGDEEPVREIERLYIDMIARAKRWIYAESQYFASRRIAEAITLRLEEAGGPEIVIVNPVSAQGWLEPLAMDSARARLFERLRRRDAEGRLRMYHPHTDNGTPIYVHAKIMIVDDAMIRVGSSNFNNRSMRLDTECDIVIDTDQGDNRGRTAQIAIIRTSLLAEHLGVEPAEVERVFADTGSLIATVDTLRGRFDKLRPYEVPDLPAVEKWLADNEVLDPEGPEEMFESIAARGLFRGRLARHRRSKAS